MMKYGATRLCRFGFMMFFISLLSGVSYAETFVIPASAVVSPISHHLGDGLRGEFYKLGYRVDHIDDAERVVATTTPDRTFQSTLVDYPNGHENVMPSTGRLRNYLGRDRDSLDGHGRVTLTDTVLRFHGLIKITEDMDGNRDSPTIDVGFAVGSDDGCRLRIGGQIIAEWLTMRSYGFVSGVAAFVVEGLYHIELICFEHEGHAGIELYTTIKGGPDYGAPEDFAGIVPTYVLSSNSKGIGGHIKGLDVTHQQCWNLTTDQVVQLVENGDGDWTCGSGFQWEPWDMIQIITIGTGR